MFFKENKIIPLDKFINEALYNESKGYYMKNNPFGYNGDYITAPNISILFSEMIAIWLVAFWEKLNSPKKINIVELGAGNGEMMYQINKSVEKFKFFNSATNFFIFEKSKNLKNLQKEKNNYFNVKWIDDFKSMLKVPTVFIANEFFDALPIKQFKKIGKLWFERCIRKKKQKFEFCFKKTNVSSLEKKIEKKITKNQNFIEYSPLSLKFLKSISEIINKNNGAMLMIDYGYNREKMFDTLIGYKKHRKINILDNVYNSDITHFINFNFYKRVLNKFNLDCINLTSQRNFLIKMGVQERAEILSKNLSFSKKADLYLRLQRLINKTQMGELFKVLMATRKKNFFNLGF